jgi:CarD family transcriptional regulator
MIEPIEPIDFEVGDSVVYPHHGAGQVVRKEIKEVLGERREYLTIKILHNDMTVMVPTENAARAGLRRVIDEDMVKKVLAVLQDECSEMPKNWNRRFKHNRDKIKTGDVYELAEVVRNLAIREAEKGLSTGEKQMFTRARKILASELMYALEMTAEQVEVHLDSLLLDSTDVGPKSRSNGKLVSANGKLASVNGESSSNGSVEAAGDLAHP